MLRIILKSIVIVGVAFLGVAWFTQRGQGPIPTANSPQADPVSGTPLADSAVVDPAHVAPASEPAAPSPRIEFTESVHEFGVVQPLATYRHAFTIHNTGAAPLELSGQESSCKCLRVEVPTPVIAPGESGQIVLAWDAKETQDVFYQTATLKTNDPQRPEIRFGASGRVKLLLAADPPTLSAPRVTPGQPATVETTIVSQTWDGFDVHSIQSSLEGATWELAPATAAELARLKSKSGWRLIVTLPDNLPEGNFTHWLRFAAEASGRQGAATEETQQLSPSADNLITVPASDTVADASAGPVEREILLEGKVLRRLAVYGEGIDAAGVIHAGVITAAKGYEGQFALRVNDPQRQLKVGSIQVEPEFLQVRVEPVAGQEENGLYRLMVQIPASAESGIYQNDKRGKIRIQWNHPRIAELQLGVEFVMAGGTSRFGAREGISSLPSR